MIGLPVLHMDHNGVCRGCFLGKNTKGSFSNSESRSKEILDLVHSDLCGPMTVALLGGYNYYVTFIDDYSQKIGYTFSRPRNPRKCLASSKNLKHKSRICQERGSRL